jgi:anti-sigma B factor antagonist
LPAEVKEQRIKNIKVMPLEIQISKSVNAPKSGAVTFKLIGSLDTATAPELDRQMVECLAGRVNDLVFDLALLKFVSSAGLRLFSVARKQMVARGGRASFINMQPQVEEVFAIVQSLPGITVFKDLAALDRYLATRQGLPPGSADLT